MLFCRASLPLMAAGSAIVFISSTASIRPGTRIPSYDASKAALPGLCRHVALEGEALGVRANVLAPGPIDTPLGRNASARRPARAAQRLPFGREGTSWEVAYATLFLLSHEASFVNAQVIGPMAASPACSCAEPSQGDFMPRIPYLTDEQAGPPELVAAIRKRRGGRLAELARCCSTARLRPVGAR